MLPSAARAFKGAALPIEAIAFIVPQKVCLQAPAPLSPNLTVLLQSDSFQSEIPPPPAPFAKPALFVAKYVSGKTAPPKLVVQEVAPAPTPTPAPAPIRQMSRQVSQDVLLMEGLWETRAMMRTLELQVETAKANTRKAAA